jgi:hypothetical protein
MATISITIPDAALTRVINAVCGIYAYDPASGLTQAAFAKQQVANFVKKTLLDWETQQAITTARQSAIDSANQVAIT